MWLETNDAFDSLLKAPVCSRSAGKQNKSDTMSHTVVGLGKCRVSCIFVVGSDQEGWGQSLFRDSALRLL